ncbi:MAG: alkaline phosphatase family protein, partial [Bacteroidota bacterium]
TIFIFHQLKYIEKMGKAFERVVVVFLENTMRSSALANPYLNQLRQKGVFMSNAQGVTHPSQPNYIATIAGDTMGIADDDAHYMDWFWVTPDSEQAHDTGSYRWHEEGYSPVTLVDLLEANNLSWKCYVESLPPDAEYKDKLQYDLTQSPAENLTRVPSDNGLFPYARKHVPFLSFPSIVSNPDRLAKIVHADEFEADMKNEHGAYKLPHFSFYVPDLLNDGHNVTEELYRPAANNIDLGPNTPNLMNIENFLRNFLGNDPVGKFPPETLIVITFDEAYPYAFDYGIYTLLLGDFLQAGTTCADPVNHYSLLRSIEDNFGIGSLKRHDAMARPYWFLRD